MKRWQRYGICITLGLLGGGALAVQAIRGGLNDGTVEIGPWQTGKSFGTVDASTLTRAKVALTGLLALPSKEAMYFTAQNDSDGRALDGRCMYVVRGGKLDGRWWSITLYEGEGWLVKNAANRWSVAGNAPARDAQGNWSFTVSPNPTEGVWLPTGGTPHFDLTLRTYHPRGALLNDPANAKLPIVTRKACA